MEEFNYTYKAISESERREIESIKSQYTPPKTEEGRLERLRKLNSYVTSSATCVALILGVCGLLIFGLGLTMILEWGLILFGVLVAVIGLPIIIVAYPVYKAILKRNKKKYGPEIVRLSDELLK